MAADNAGCEDDGPSTSRGMKMERMKMPAMKMQIARHVFSALPSRPYGEKHCTADA